MFFSLTRNYCAYKSQRCKSENEQAIDFLLSHRYLTLPTSAVYAAVMKKHGLQPETVTLPHNTEGHWIGNKDAKTVIIYYHGAFPISTE